MGMYTELRFATSIHSDCPQWVTDILKFMCGPEETTEDLKVPEHPLFKTHRWEVMLRCDSYYFDADTRSTIRYDEIGKCYMLTIQCNLKNYDNEIEHFLNWITPYIFACDVTYLGHYMYEEANTPTLLFMGEDKLGNNLIRQVTSEFPNSPP